MVSRFASLCYDRNRNSKYVVLLNPDTVIMAIFTIWRKIQKKEEDLRLILKDMLAKNENIRLYRNGLILSTLGEFSPIQYWAASINFGKGKKGCSSHGGSWREQRRSDCYNLLAS